MVHLVKVRVDATRNRQRIIVAARELVARDGPDVTMEALARRAEVAVGTLYRHFPTKNDLVAAVVEESVSRIADLAEAALQRISEGAAPGEEIKSLFRTVAAEHSSDRAIKQAAAALDVAVDVRLDVLEPGTPLARAASALTGMLDAAKAVGVVDRSVTVDDLAMLLAQVPDDSTGAIRGRYLDIVLAGLIIAR